MFWPEWSVFQVNTEAKSWSFQHKTIRSEMTDFLNTALQFQNHLSFISHQISWFMIHSHCQLNFKRWYSSYIRLAPSFPISWLLKHWSLHHHKFHHNVCTNDNPKPFSGRHTSHTWYHKYEFQCNDNGSITVWYVCLISGILYSFNAKYIQVSIQVFLALLCGLSVCIIVICHWYLLTEWCSFLSTLWPWDKDYDHHHLLSFLLGDSHFCTWLVIDILCLCTEWVELFYCIFRTWRHQS